jgi:diketogulonate reductase-like aldo/keto reductase
MTSAAAIPNASLNDENTIPVLGIGVGDLTEEQTEHAVSSALEIGIRLIDTAAAYGNEAAVGRAVAASGIPRAEIFVSTKLAAEDQGFQAAQDALKASLDRLGMDYVDAYLIHWPAAGDADKYVNRWGGLMKARQVGHTKSIGVCNFTADDLSNVIDLSFFVPAINQIELHPLLNQAALRAVNAEHASSPRRTGHWASASWWRTRPSESIAGEYGKTPRRSDRWSIQLGNVVIPGRRRPAHRRELRRIRLRIVRGAMDRLNALDDGTRFRPDPETYTGT